MPNTTQIADILFKKGLGLGTTQSGRAFFEEPIKARPFIDPSQIWTEAYRIPDTAPSSTSGIVQRLTGYQLTGVVGTTNSFTGALLRDAIPFNWGDGTSYNYTVLDSTSTQIAFGVNDWVIDTEAGILMFNAGVPSNMPPTISFWRYSGQKGLTGGFLGTGQSGLFYPNNNPSGYIANSGFVTGVDNIGAGSGLFSGISNNKLEFKTLIGGSGIKVTGDSNSITISVTGITGGGGAGEINTASNLGSGSGIWFQKVGVDLQFKSLKVGPDLSITGSTGELSINLTGSFVRTTDTGSFITNAQTGQFYPSSNPNGYITSAQVGGVQTVNITGSLLSGALTFTGVGNVTVTKSGQIITWSGNTGNLVDFSMLSGASGALSDRLNSTGTTLLSLIQAASAGVSAINGLSGILSLTGAGNVTVSNAGQTITISGNTENFVTTGQTGQFYSSTNPSNYIANSGFLTGFLNGPSGSSGIASGLLNNQIQFFGLSGATGISITSISGVGVLVLSTTGLVLNSQTGNLITTSQTGNFVTTSQTGSFVTTNQTGNFVTTSQTGQFYAASNPNNYISNSGFITGFSNGPSGSSGIASGIVSNKIQFYGLSGSTGILMSSISGVGALVFSITGVVLNSQTGNFVTASQTGSFVTTSQTGSFVTTNQTGSFITTSQTGQFYATSNPSNYISNSGFITGFLNGPSGSSGVASGILNNQIQFFGLSGSTGINITSVSGVGALVLSTTGLAISANLVSTGSNLQTQINTLTSWTGITTGLYYPLNSNPSNYVTGSVVRPTDTGSFVTTSQTGAYTGQFYPYSSNPAGYITAAGGVDGVTGISVTGGTPISGLVTITGIGGVTITQSGNTITFSGASGNGTVNNFNNTYINSGSGLYVFQTLVNTGISEQFVVFPTALDSNPTVVASLRNNSTNNIIPFQISGAVNTGYWAIFGETVNETGYYVNTIACSSTGTGLATIIINNTTVGIYRNFWVDAGAMLPTSVSGATAGTVNYNGTDNLAADAFLFDDTTAEYVNFKLMMPDEWNKGSIKVKLGWSPSSGNGNVVWQVAGAAVGDLQNIGSGLLGTAVTIIDSGVNTGQFHLTTGSPSITIGNSPSTGMMTYFRIGRLPSDASDTISGDAKLLGVGIQYLESTTIPVSW